MARVLVTGAAGFIGSNLVRTLLSRGDEVHACVRSLETSWRLPEHAPNLFFHLLDITNSSEVNRVVKDVVPETVYHLSHYGGNRGQSDEAMVRAVIIDGTASLFAACKELPVPSVIIQTGSSSEYGTKTVPMSESMFPEPNTPYGCAKLWATLYAEHLRREEGMKITTLRLFSAYGPYEAKNRLVPAVILALQQGVSPTLANPMTSRDFIYVQDVVDALVHAAGASVHGVYNIGRGENVSLQTMVEGLHADLHSDVSLVWGGSQDLSFDTAVWVADMTHTKEELGWEPHTSLTDGIEQTVRWFADNASLYDIH